MPFFEPSIGSIDETPSMQPFKNFSTKAGVVRSALTGSDRTTSAFQKNVSTSCIDGKNALDVAIHCRLKDAWREIPFQLHRGILHLCNKFPQKYHGGHTCQTRVLQGKYEKQGKEGAAYEMLTAAAPVRLNAIPRVTRS